MSCAYCVLTSNIALFDGSTAFPRVLYGLRGFADAAVEDGIAGGNRDALILAVHEFNEAAHCTGAILLREFAHLALNLWPSTGVSRLSFLEHLTPPPGAARAR